MKKVTKHTYQTVALPKALIRELKKANTYSVSLNRFVEMLLGALVQSEDAMDSAMRVAVDIQFRRLHSEFLKEKGKHDGDRSVQTAG